MYNKASFRELSNLSNPKLDFVYGENGSLDKM